MYTTEVQNNKRNMWRYLALKWLWSTYAKPSLISDPVFGKIQTLHKPPKLLTMKKGITEASFSKWILSPMSVSFKSLKSCTESLHCAIGPSSHLFRARCSGQCPVKFWNLQAGTLPASLSNFYSLTVYRMENILPFIRA